MSATSRGTGARAAALTGPARGSLALGFLLAVGYGAWVLRASLSDVAALLIAAAVGAVIAAVVAELSLRRAVGRRAPSALVAAAGSPGAVSALQGWIVGWAVASLAYAVRGKGTAFAAFCELAVLWGPAHIALAVAWTGQRAVREMGRAGRGMEPAVLLDALAAEEGRLRRRLTGVLCAGAWTPTALLVDATWRLGDGLDAHLIATWIAVVVASGAVSLTAAILAARAVTRPLQRLAERSGRALSGRLLLQPAEGEAWALTAAITRVDLQLGAAIQELKRAGARIGQSSESIVATSGKYQVGARDQATSLNQTSATTEELARSARQIAQNASSVADLARQTLESARGAKASARAFSDSMARMRQDNQSITGAVERLSSRVQQIGKIVEFIDGVAEKSDLLALSAELEGTKAGEVGRGFWLVAAEMRRLAENVIESTNEIEELIDEIRVATVGAVQATRAGVQATEGGMGLAQQVTQSLEDIDVLAESTAQAVGAISTATQQQQSGTDQLAQTMAEILRVTHQGLKATEGMSAANEGLAAVAKDLESLARAYEAPAP